MCAVAFGSPPAANRHHAEAPSQKGGACPDSDPAQPAPAGAKVTIISPAMAPGEAPVTVQFGIEGMRSRGWNQ